MTNVKTSDFSKLTKTDLAHLDKELLISLVLNLRDENKILRALHDETNWNDSKRTIDYNSRLIDKKDKYSHRETIINIKESAHNNTGVDYDGRTGHPRESINDFVYKLPSAIDIHAEHTPGAKGDIVLTFLEGKFSYTVPNDYDVNVSDDGGDIPISYPEHAYLFVAVKRADRKVPIGCFRLKQGVAEMQLVANM